MRAVICELPPEWLAERQQSEAAQWDEVWHGVLHMPPMPNRVLQDIAADLLVFLKVHWVPQVSGRVHQEVNLTTPQDEPHWTLNYRIPDLVLLLPESFPIDRVEYMAGAPNAVVEIASPGDETLEKLPFYAGLGVPEVWVIDRDTRVMTMYHLDQAHYRAANPNAEGWLASHLGLEFRHPGEGQLTIRLAHRPESETAIPG